MLPSHLGVHTDQRQIILTCRWLGAIDPASARAEHELNPHNSAVWGGLVQKGWIREAEPGFFYLNERIVPRTWGERHGGRAAAITFAALGGIVLLIYALIDRG
jgi:hypothetical protein